MKVSVTTPSETTRKLAIEVPSEHVGKAIERETDKLRKDVQLPGFRRGKAPVGMIRTQYARQIEVSALEAAINENVRKAVESENLSPLGPATISNMQYDPGSDLKFTATIEVEPNFSLGNLTGMRVDREERDVTGEMIDDALKRIQLRLSTVRTKEEPAENGDRLHVDIEEIDPATGVSLIGKQHTDQVIRLGEIADNAEFDEKLIGVKTGEKRRVVLRTNSQMIVDPQMQQSPVEAHYHVTVKRVEAVDLPAVDDDLAREMKFENLEDMRRHVEENLKTQLKDASNRKMYQALEREVVRIVNPPVPQTMVDRYVDYLYESVSNMMPGEQPPDPEKLRQESMETAREKVKWFLIREKITEQEGLTVTDQEIEDYLNDYAEIHNLDRKRVSLEYRTGKKRDDLRNNLLDIKVYTYLEGKAAVKTVKVS